MNKGVREKLQAWFVSAAAEWLQEEGSTDLRLRQSVAELLIEAVADFGRAEEVLRLGLEADGSEKASALRLMGRLAIRKGDYNLAERYYSEALGLLGTLEWEPTVLKEV